VDVDLACAVDRAEELDPARAVDEIEEYELPHPPPPEHAAGDAALLRALGARGQRLGLGADGGDLVAVREALGRHAASVVIRRLRPRAAAHHPGVRPARRRAASSTTSKPWCS
jgi:hypothetical protein